VTAVYFGAVLSALVLAGFLSYYVFRLATASRKGDDLDRRLSQLLPTVSTSSDYASAPGGPTVPRVLQRAGVGLGDIYSEPVFLRRDKAESVTFQVGGRPSTPLKFLLDHRSRSVLEQVAALADKELGPAWALLAEEDEQGLLLMTPL
jgi:hypothetical protein